MIQWLALDRADGLDLLTWMENSDFTPVNENTVKHIATFVIRILNKVHQHGFAHKDIKLENVRIFSESSSNFLGRF
jgi:serine/threonine protein kinase